MIIRLNSIFIARVVYVAGKLVQPFKSYHAEKHIPIWKVLWILNAPLHPGKIYKSIKAFILNNINPLSHSQSDEMRLMVQISIGNALKRSPGIIRKSRVSYPGPGFLSSATWPSLPKKHYNGLNQTKPNINWL